MNIRRFRALHEAGATFVEIGRECGCDWRTVKKYLAEDAPRAAGRPPRAGTQPLLIAPLVPVVESWLRADIAVEGTVIHERLVAEPASAATISGSRCSWPRPGRGSLPSSPRPMRIRRRGCIAGSRSCPARRSRSTGATRATCSPTSASRRLLLPHGLVLLARPVPASPPAWTWPSSGTATAGRSPTSAACRALVYDRTKTSSAACRPGLAPLHPEAAAFADHYGFVIDVPAAHRPTGKGRVERQVKIVRDHVIAGRSFASIAELDGAFHTWESWTARPGVTIALQELERRGLVTHRRGTVTIIDRDGLMKSSNGAYVPRNGRNGR